MEIAQTMIGNHLQVSLSLSLSLSLLLKYIIMHVYMSQISNCDKAVVNLWYSVNCSLLSTQNPALLPIRSNYPT